VHSTGQVGKLFLTHDLQTNLVAAAQFLDLIATLTATPLSNQHASDPLWAVPQSLVNRVVSEYQSLHRGCVRYV
jgi:hypothetical protein